MKAPPLLFGGSSPVVAYLRHSMMVVLPDPLYPTMRVSGVLNCMASRTAGLKDRMPEMESLSILDMATTRLPKVTGGKRHGEGMKVA
jgi:hypothetical protein